MADHRIIEPEGAFRRWTRRIVATTSLVSPLANPFDSYGVVAAEAIVRERSLKPKGFSVAEARARLSDLIDGRFSPKTFADLTDHLKERFLRLEMRIFDGSMVNLVVNTMGSGAVPAADVGMPRRYLAKLIGVETLAPKKLSGEELTARDLRTSIAGRLLNQEANGTIFTNWDDAFFQASIAFKVRGRDAGEGLDMTARGDEIWLGPEHARSVSDPAANLKIIRSAAARGIKLIVPARTLEDAAAGKLVPGMPILRRDGAVRASLVHPSLSYGSMTKAYGESPFDHFAKMASRSRGRHLDSVGGDKVVDMAGFKQMIRQRKKPDAAPLKEVTSVARDTVLRHEIDFRGREVLVYEDPVSGDDEEFAPSRAAAGTYKTVNSFGLPTGSVRVDEDGGYAFFDGQMRLHNDLGAAIVPSARSGRSAQHALEGRVLSESAFRSRASGKRRATALAKRAPGPEVDAASDGGFGDEFGGSGGRDYDAEGGHRNRM